MKTYSTFKQIYDAYKAGEIDEALMEEARLLANGFDKPKMSDEELLELTKQAYQSYMFLIGGDFHVCEVEVDLKQIKGIDIDWFLEHNEWPDVTQCIMDWDVCEFLNNEPATGWFVFMLCSNNAGGHVFYVPKKLWERARVYEHIHRKNSIDAYYKDIPIHGN